MDPIWGCWHSGDRSQAVQLNGVGGQQGGRKEEEAIWGMSSAWELPQTSQRPGLEIPLLSKEVKSLPKLLLLYLQIKQSENVHREALLTSYFLSSLSLSRFLPDFLTTTPFNAATISRYKLPPQHLFGFSIHFSGWKLKNKIGPKHLCPIPLSPKPLLAPSGRNFWLLGAWPPSLSPSLTSSWISAEEGECSELSDTVSPLHWEWGGNSRC